MRYRQPMTTTPAATETIAQVPERRPRTTLAWIAPGALLVALAALGFAVPWWIENGASVYVSLLASGLTLCL